MQWFRLFGFLTELKSLTRGEGVGCGKIEGTVFVSRGAEVGIQALHSRVPFLVETRQKKKHRAA